MEKVIDLNQTVYELYTQYPDILPIMQELGFENVTKPGMLQTAGRVMTIPNGCKMKGISLDAVTKTSQNYGFTIKK